LRITVAIATAEIIAVNGIATLIGNSEVDEIASWEFTKDAVSSKVPPTASGWQRKVSPESAQMLTLSAQTLPG
jgi:hypothetical protein